MLRLATPALWNTEQREHIHRRECFELSQLRVAVIGTGLAFERLHLPVYRRLKDDYRIVALCDQDVTRAKSHQQELCLADDQIYQDWRPMVARDDVDVIDIMVPIELNFAMTAAVARAISGSAKGIICEKPLGANLREAAAARELPSECGVPIMIAENRRYTDDTNIIRDMVRTGRIGQVEFFTYSRSTDFPSSVTKNDFAATEWRQQPEYPGGAITDEAIHDIAAMRHVFGSIASIHSLGRPQAADYSPYSAILVNLSFASGVVGQFSFYCAGREPLRPLAGWRIFGTMGMIYLEEPDCGRIVVAATDGSVDTVTYQPGSGFYNELVNFAKALRGHEPVSVPPEMEYGDLKTIQDMLYSASSGTVVAVDQTPDYTPDYGGAEAWAEPGATGGYMQ